MGVVFDFDLQLFGGGGSTTTTQTYEPSDYELQLQKSQADYADAVAPNALWLNNIARQVLADSLGTVQVDYDKLNQQAQAQNLEGMNYVRDAVSRNDKALDFATDQMGKKYNEISGIVGDYTGNTDALLGDNSAATDWANNRLNDLLPRYGEISQAGIDAANHANAGLGDLISKYRDTYDRYSGVRSRLINGELPSRYMDNMAESMRSAINRTMGANLNSLANRGVINSSVAQGAMDDISRNVSDAMAQKYLDSINTVGGLLTSGVSDAVNLLGNQGNLYGQQYNITGNALDRGANMLDRQGSLTQQMLNNVYANNKFAFDVYNQQYANQMGGNAAQSDLLQNYMQDVTGVNAQRANAGNTLAGNATAGISTAAAAQEAAQTPASNLWNMSLGLNNANTGALAAAAGKGTTTTTQSRGGGLFSGLMGGLF